jgi:hypothetical protein
MAKIKLTFEQILNNHKHYIEFGTRNDLPLQIAFKYSKALKQINEEAIDIEKQRGTLISKYGLDKAENHANPEVNTKADEEWRTFVRGNSIKIDFEPMSIKGNADKIKNVSPAMLVAMAEFFTD